MGNVRRISDEKRREIEALLKAAYGGALNEPMPKSINDTLAKLK